MYGGLYGFSVGREMRDEIRIKLSEARGARGASFHVQHVDAQPPFLCITT